MPSHIPKSNPLEIDETHDEERRRVPSSGDRHQQPDRERATSKGDTDPDSPDADIDRDDMVDEP